MYVYAHTYITFIHTYIHTYIRVGLVYEILLNSMGVSCEPPSYAELGRCSPIRMKMVCTV